MLGVGTHSVIVALCTYVTSKAVGSTLVRGFTLRWKPRVFCFRVQALIWSLTGTLSTLHPLFGGEEEAGEEVSLGLGLPASELTLCGTLVTDELCPLAGAKSVEGAGSGADTSFGTVTSSSGKFAGTTRGEKSEKTTSFSESMLSSPRRMILNGVIFRALSTTSGMGGCFAVTSASASGI